MLCRERLLLCPEMVCMLCSGVHELWSSHAWDHMNADVVQAGIPSHALLRGCALWPTQISVPLHP